VRTVKPRGLPLRRSDRTPQQDMAFEVAVTILTNLNWTIAEKGAVLLPWERVVYVDLTDQAEELFVDFELKVRLLDNRRKERRVRARTNVVKQV
jgi:hypothetical protein